MNSKYKPRTLLLNVRSIRSKLNMHEIQHIVSGLNIIGFTETLPNAIDLNIDTHEVFTGNDKLILKEYRGPAFIVRKSFKYEFTETDLGLWLKVELEATDYWFRLYYLPGECSRHWDVQKFEKIQDDALNFEKFFDSNVLLLGDFNARIGVSEDFVELHNEQIDIPNRSNPDEITNFNGHCPLDL